MGRTDNRTSYALPCCCATSPTVYPEPCDLHACLGRFARRRSYSTGGGFFTLGGDLHAVVHILRGADFLRRHPVVWQFYVIYCTPDSTPFHAFLRPNQNPDAGVVENTQKYTISGVWGSAPHPKSNSSPPTEPNHTALIQPCSAAPCGWGGMAGPWAACSSQAHNP